MTGGLRHREILALLLLSALGILAFVGTRELAASNAALRHADAVAWHERGQRALEEGDTARALTALRRASHMERRNRDIAVSLALALRAAGRDDEAAAVLEGLRAEQPDDGEVNLQLARLEATRNLPAAIRYYQDALDALWAPASAERSRTVRRELITLLQQHGERARALSQALVYAAELPPTPDSQLQAAHLLLELGDPRRALDRYTAVLQADPRSREGRAGAGEAAFALGDYAAARRYLARAEPLEPRLASLRRVADLVLTVDPLASRLRRSERERRLRLIAQHARERLDRCDGAVDDAPALDEQLQAFEPARARSSRRPAAPRADADDADDRFERGIDIALRIERATIACGPQDDMGRALTIIAREHGLDGTR